MRRCTRRILRPSMERAVASMAKAAASAARAPAVMAKGTLLPARVSVLLARVSAVDRVLNLAEAEVWATVTAATKSVTEEQLQGSDYLSVISRMVFVPRISRMSSRFTAVVRR